MTKNRKTVLKRVKSTTYAQLSQHPPTVLYTTYCGSGGDRVQILGARPGMSTRIRHICAAFFSPEKNPRQINIFADPDA
jgi:hypothetical protein